MKRALNLRKISKEKDDKINELQEKIEKRAYEIQKKI